MENLINKKIIGKTENNIDVLSYTIKNKNGMELEVLNYGGIIKSILVPEPDNNNLIDVVLGFDNIQGYEQDDCYIGSIVGRVANRIAKGKFILNDKHYDLALNNGNNHLHGGIEGFNKKIWDIDILNNNTIKLEYLSKDGEEGYPGNLDISVTYSLSDENEVIIVYNATTDKDTIINLTNHSYFNLDGIKEDSTIEDHILNILSNKITESDEEGISTGNLLDIMNTPLDFSKEKRIGEHIEDDFKQLRDKNGYDHNYVLNYDTHTNIVAKTKSLKTGITLSVYTNQRGVQLYTGNYLEGTGKNNNIYKKYSGFCLETQNFPNAINILEFDSGILEKGELYNHKTIYKFN